MPKPLRKIAVAPNAFKGTLTALEAARCIAKGLRASMPGVQTVMIPMADGGDGTAAAIVQATGGRLLRARARDPLGRTIRTEWGLTGDGQTAILEMATASGLALLTPRERNPLLACSFGTGELIRHALDRDVKKILVGIGGSATNDGGMGMARALGVRFLDRRGHDLPPGGGALRRLHRIDLTRRDPRLLEVQVEVACDVTNPLTGPRGASSVYGPQKGATPAMVRALDAGLRRLDHILRNDHGIHVAGVPGSGAAGGMGAGLMAFAGGRLRPGIDIVIDAVNLRERIAGCDLLITGEGRLDSQTASGKAPAGVARVAARQHIPVIALCGSLASGTGSRLPKGIHACFSALEELMDEPALAGRAADMLTQCACQIGRVLRLSY